MFKVRSILAMSTVLVCIAGAAPLEAHQTPRTVTLTVTDPVGEKMSYSLKQIVAKPGEKLRIRIVSLAQTPKIVMAHNFLLLKQGTNVKAFTDAAAGARETDYIPPAFKSAIITQTAMAGPGETMEVTFTAPAKPGTYVFLCSFAGHWAAGMTGDFIVK
jgi:azurin